MHSSLMDPEALGKMIRGTVREEISRALEANIQPINELLQNPMNNWKQLLTIWMDDSTRWKQNITNFLPPPLVNIAHQTGLMSNGNLCMITKLHSFEVKGTIQRLVGAMGSDKLQYQRQKISIYPYIYLFIYF